MSNTFDPLALTKSFVYTLCEQVILQRFLRPFSIRLARAPLQRTIKLMSLRQAKATTRAQLKTHAYALAHTL